MFHAALSFLSFVFISSLTHILQIYYLHCLERGNLPKMSKKTTSSPSFGMLTGLVLRSKARRAANPSSRAKRHGEIYSKMGGRRGLRVAKGNEISESVMRFCQVCLNEYLGTRKGTGGKRTQQLVPELIALMLRNQRHEVYKYSRGKGAKTKGGTR